MDMDVDCWSLDGSRRGFDGWMGCRERNGGYRRLEQDRLDWPTRPHHDSGFPDSRFPDSRFWNSEFRIPYGVWRIPNTAP